MIKIGAKLIKNHKTIKKADFISTNNYNSDDFFFYMCQICKQLDISVPIIVDYKVKCYERFNSVEFTKDDFVDTINFDMLFIENDDR